MLAKAAPMRFSSAMTRLLCAALALAGTVETALGQFRLPSSIAAAETTDSSDDAVYADYFANGEFDFANYQPPAPQLSAPPQPAAPRRSATGGRQSGIRLASVPNMFGDAPTTPLMATFVGTASNTFVTGEIPVPGFGGLSAKLAENDRPIPTDRVFFSYNHFHNVFQVVEDSLVPGDIRRQQSMDRYTVGFEKTYFDGWSSIELRMPFYGTFGFRLNDFILDDGNIGNLAVVLKHLLYYDDELAIGAGVAIDTPTGSDMVAQFAFSRVRFSNEAVHLLPYIGFNYAPGEPIWGWNDGLFMTGIVQASVAANGTRVDLIDPAGNPIAPYGKLNDPTLLLVDFNVGYWLYRDPDAPRLTGLAVVGEVHYTTSVQDGDSVSGPLLSGGATIGAAGNRFDVVNGTIGVQALLFDASSLRVAGAFPLKDGRDERFFDSEIQVQFNRNF
jgi:hypothetical protein